MTRLSQILSYDFTEIDDDSQCRLVIARQKAPCFSQFLRHFGRATGVFRRLRARAPNGLAPLAFASGLTYRHSRQLNFDYSHSPFFFGHSITAVNGNRGYLMANTAACYEALRTSTPVLPHASRLIDMKIRRQQRQYRHNATYATNGVGLKIEPPAGRLERALARAWQISRVSFTDVHTYDASGFEL